MRSRLGRLPAVALVACALVSWSDSAYANTGIPMLVLAWPASWIALIPVVLVESYLAKGLLGLEWKRALRISAAANAVSTFVGIPITWAAMLGLEIVFGLAADAVDAVDTGAAVPEPLAVVATAAWLSGSKRWHVARNGCPLRRVLLLLGIL